ncbi:uncharacterized protein LOC142350608 isoform X2 [Convolutriloba macropyga]|uniref:uncharacterized protein LOC142350608 isoform X2 n=1 Tax=Convolutriloba macropyga TaxID=536237 RepID=UPI003F527996
MFVACRCDGVIILVILLSFLPTRVTTLANDSRKLLPVRNQGNMRVDTGSYGEAIIMSDSEEEIEQLQQGEGQSKVIPLWVAVVGLTVVGGMLALMSLVCSVRFRRKERELETLRRMQRESQLLHTRCGGEQGNIGGCNSRSFCCSTPHRCLCPPPKCQCMSRLPAQPPPPPTTQSPDGTVLTETLSTKPKTSAQLSILNVNTTSV